MSSKSKSIIDYIYPEIRAVKDGVRYQDLDETYYIASIEFLKKEYFPHHLFWSQIKDHTELEELSNRFLGILKNNCSLIAIDEQTKKIIGVAVAARMTKKEYSWLAWKMQPTKSEVLKTLINFDYNLIKSSQEKLKCYASLHIFLVHNAKNYSKQFIKEELLQQTFAMTKYLKIDGITFICHTENEKERAERVGMEHILTQNYFNSQETSANPVFKTTRRNYYANVYALDKRST